MRRLVLSSIGVLALLGGASAAAPQSAAIRLAPHRVVYDLSLAKSTGTRGVESARGRIAFDFLGDDCEGYTLKFRQVTVLESGETGTRTSDLRTATFEEGTGASFRFRNDSLLEGSSSVVDGEAERRSGSVQVRLKQPKRETLSFTSEASFPTDHMKRLIAAAQRGETTMAVKVFDGSDDGRKLYDTLAVIGRRIEPGLDDAIEQPSRQDALARLPRWPVTLSYFVAGEGERTPLYVISFELYENGVSRALRLDYGDFALNGDLHSLDLHPESNCQR